MNNATYESIFGHKRIRKTWKRTLSPEKNAARVKQMQFCKKVRAILEPHDYTVEFHFNPGGPAVWGETYVHVYWTSQTGETSTTVPRIPVVEACLSVDFSYIRQWDGRNSGRNVQCQYATPRDVQMFVSNVRSLSSKPFVRF